MRSFYTYCGGGRGASPYGNVDEVVVDEREYNPLCLFSASALALVQGFGNIQRVRARVKYMQIILFFYIFFPQHTRKE